MLGTVCGILQAKADRRTILVTTSKAARFFLVSNLPPAQFFSVARHAVVEKSTTYDASFFDLQLLFKDVLKRFEQLSVVKI